MPEMPDREIARDPGPEDAPPAENPASNVREVDPDPGNRASIRDTAGDTTDHS